MLSGLWIKLTGILTVIMTALLFIIGYQRKAGKRKDEIIDGHEKKSEIIDDTRLAEVKAKEAEKDAVSKINTDDWRGNLND